jgi:hypothetical protein
MSIGAASNKTEKNEAIQNGVVSTRLLLLLMLSLVIVAIDCALWANIAV